MDLIPQLAAFIPRDRVEAIVSQRPLSHDGALLMADISGFTPLTEALTHGLQADHGAEELTRALESVFTPLIEEVHQHKGSVITFIGDAMILWFGRDKGQRRKTVMQKALTTAVSMQAVMEKHGTIATPIGDVVLRMKIGASYGRVKRFRLGLSDIGYEDALAGETLDEMSEAEHHANPGDIVIAPDAYPLIEDWISVREWRDGHPVLGGIKRPSFPTPWPPLTWPEANEPTIIDELAAYVPNKIVEQLLIGQSNVAELHPVVSMFVQFHGFSYDDDPQVVEKLQHYFTTAQRVVSRYSGSLNRLTIGDKGSVLHIIFGAPVIVEEQETRALRCALDLMAECGKLPIITMQRVGATAGRAFAGPVGSVVRHDYTVMGDAINVSSRLMQAAGDNQILAETAVVHRANDTIVADHLTPIHVKGKTEPIAVSLIKRYQYADQSIRKLPRLFGRTHELTQIRKAVHGLEHGKGAIKLIIGEVGLGKSLMLETIREELENNWLPNAGGGMLASGLALAYGGSISGFLFIDMLRDLINVPAGSTPQQTSQRLVEFCIELFGEQRLEATFPYLARFMNLPLTGEYAQRLDGLGGESVRWQIFELIPEMLRELTRHFPVVLMFDDLQWSDPTSLELIETLLPLTEERPLFLLLATRPYTFTFSDRPDIETFRLDEMTDAVAADIVHFHAPTLPKNVVAHLVERGGGNPLFLVELTRTLRSSGLTSAELINADLEQLNLPDSIQGLLLAQLDRLEAEARNTLQMASVIGKTFLDRVLHVIAQAEHQVLEQLPYLEQEDFIYPTATTEFGAAHIFRHGLVQESTYSTLLFERRRLYHLRVAEALQELFPTAVFEQASFLAHHYERADEIRQAIHYLQLAADQSRLLFAHEEAEKLYQSIIELLRDHFPDDKDELARTWMKKAQLFANQANYTMAQHYYEKAFDYFDSLKEEVVEQIEDDGEKRPFRWGLIAHESSFDPALAQSGEYSEIVKNLYEGLVEVDDEWNIIPAVARRWEILNDGTTYRFHLRDKLTWSDGQPLTAQDFVTGWRRTLDPETKASMAYMLYDVTGAEAYHTGNTADPNTVGIQAVDETTLEVTLASPSSYFLYFLADPVAFPEPTHLWKTAVTNWHTPQNFVGNGSYLLKQDDGQLQLTLNPRYRSQHPDQLRQIILESVPTTIDQFSDDQIDWCRVETFNEFEQLDQKQTKILIQGFTTYFLAFSCHGAPFDDPEMRRAFALCIDKEALVNSVWSGMPKPARGGVLPPGMPGHSPEIGIPFDPEQARQLIADKQIERVKLVSITGFGDTPDFLKQSWEQHLGVTVEMQKEMPIGEALPAIQQNEIHILLLGISWGNPNPGNILMLAKGDSPLNYWGWSNERFDELLQQTLATEQLAQRLNMYHELDAITVQESPVFVPLYYQQAYGVLRSGFGLIDGGTTVRDQQMLFKNLRQK